MLQLNVIGTVAIALVSSLGLTAHAASTSDTIQTPFAPVQEYFELNNGFEAPAELGADGQSSLAAKKKNKKVSPDRKQTSAAKKTTKQKGGATKHVGGGQQCKGSSIRCKTRRFCKSRKCRP